MTLALVENSKRVLIITYYWPPAGGAGVQRWLHFSKYLPANGWEPIILTVHPDHATYPQRDESLLAVVAKDIEVVCTKSIEPLQWYGKIAGKDRIPYGGFSNEKSNSWASKFIRGNFFIPDARRGWNHYALSAARKLIRKHPIDLVVTTGPPHSTHLIGLELSQKLRIKWVADLRDPWTQVYYNFDMPRTAIALRYDRLLERRVLGTADAVVTASPGFAARFNERVKRKYHVITNGFDQLLDPIEKPSGQPHYITYTGTMAESYKPEGLFKALAGLEDIDFRLRVAGSLSEGMLQMIRDAGLWERLDYLGYLPHDEVLEEMRRASVLLLMNPDVPGGSDIIPGKLFEYLAAQKPVLAVCGLGSAIEDILHDVNAGRCFQYNAEIEMRRFLTQVINSNHMAPDDIKRAAYRRSSLAKDMAAVLERCLMNTRA